VGRSPDISVMWRTEYYAGAGYIRHVAVKRLRYRQSEGNTTEDNFIIFSQSECARCQQQYNYAVTKSSSSSQAVPANTACPI